MYIVLDDKSTYGSCEGAYVVLLTDGGEQKLMESNDFKSIDMDAGEHVSARLCLFELIDAYNLVKGTEY